MKYIKPITTLITNEENESAILFDDNEKVRNGWHLGETVDPTTTDIIEFIERLVE